MFKLIKEVGLTSFAKAALLELHRVLWRQAVQKSYSQDYEDKVIEKLLPKKHGFYVDIGAYRPIRLSNTYLFYQKGWRGLLFEPNPDVKKDFLSLRHGDKLITAGIGVKKSKLNYYQYLIPALNTFSEEQVRINTKNGYTVSKVLKIDLINIKDIFKKYIKKRKIDFVSIDVEGWDEEILHKWNWKYKPKVICVETNGNSNRIDMILSEKGYTKYYENKVNSIYKL